MNNMNDKDKPLKMNNDDKILKLSEATFHMIVNLQRLMTKDIGSKVDTIDLENNGIKISIKIE